MNEFMVKNNYKKAFFVDDNNNNLKTCDKYPEIKQILATWGNCQPGFVGYTQEQALSEVKKFVE